MRHYTPPPLPIVHYIGQLPIDRRDYLAFTLLMPGVSDSTRLAGDQDFPVKQTQSGLSFYGSNDGNSVTVDRAEAGDDAGGVRLTVSQDAVEEFQVNRSSYGADQGGTFGGAINITANSGLRFLPVPTTTLASYAPRLPTSQPPP